MQYTKAAALLLTLNTSACVFADGGRIGSESPGDDPANPVNPIEPVDPEMTCYYAADPAVPAATIEYLVEVVNGVQLVEVRLTLDPRFADNTYGANAIGWGMAGHTFKDLTGSDHAQFQLTDGAGALVSDFKLDYLSADAAMPSGYRSLGVRGGDGKVLLGDPAAVVSTSTSMERNFNERGLASYTIDSPATDEAYTPDPAAPAWDFRVIYEFAMRADAFGAAGFGAVVIKNIHASPSKTGENTVVVDPRPCPPDWDGYCNDPDGCDDGAIIP